MIKALTGLRPENPIAWMAACGALRLLPGARLRWAGQTPELNCPSDPVAELVGMLPQRVAADEIRFDHKLSANMDESAWTDLRTLPPHWLSALGAQTERGAQGSNLRMRSGGNQHPVRDALRMLQHLSRLDEDACRDKVQEALFGPWRYEDAGLVAWGWDAAARVDAAGIGCKAEDLGKRGLTSGVLAAYWLGWEALPLFPIVNGRTLGWHPSVGLTYPTWQEWLDYPELRALMLGLARMRPREQAALGVRRWQAAFLRTDKTSGRLGWAMPIARTGIAAKSAGGSRDPNARIALIK